MTLHGMPCDKMERNGKKRQRQRVAEIVPARLGVSRRDDAWDEEHQSYRLATRIS